LQAFVALPLEVWRLAVYSVTIFIQQNFLQISLPASGPQILALAIPVIILKGLVTQRLPSLSTAFLPPNGPFQEQNDLS
jgi:hypothetical protein